MHCLFWKSNNFNLIDMVNTVKTEKKAIHILNNWLAENITEENMSSMTIIEQTSTQCECGETMAFKAFYEGGNDLAYVGVCECCGDDDGDDVLNIV